MGIWAHLPPRRPHLRQRKSSLPRATALAPGVVAAGVKSSSSKKGSLWSADRGTEEVVRDTDVVRPGPHGDGREVGALPRLPRSVEGHAPRRALPARSRPSPGVLGVPGTPVSALCRPSFAEDPRRVGRRGSPPSHAGPAPLSSGGCTPAPSLPTVPTATSLDPAVPTPTSSSPAATAPGPSRASHDPCRPSAERAASLWPRPERPSPGSGRASLAEEDLPAFRAVPTATAPLDSTRRSSRVRLLATRGSLATGWGLRELMGLECPRLERGTLSGQPGTPPARSGVGRAAPAALGATVLRECGVFAAGVAQPQDAVPRRIPAGEVTDGAGVFGGVLTAAWKVAVERWEPRGSGAWAWLPWWRVSQNPWWRVGVTCMGGWCCARGWRAWWRRWWG